MMKRFRGQIGRCAPSLVLAAVAGALADPAMPTNPKSPAGMVVYISGGDAPAPAPVLDFGLDLGILCARDTDVHGADRLRVAGPFYETQSLGDRLEFEAYRPFYSVTRDRQREYVIRDYLWPLGTSRVRGQDRYWRFLLFFGHDFEEETPDGRYRTVIFPVACWGRDAAHHRYGAVFPIGGRVREFLGRDEIDFVLFPLYMKSEVNRVRTHDVVWPILSWTRGSGVRRFRCFPLYGHSVDEGRWEKRFVLWPIWNSVRYDLPRSRGSAFILFPLFGRVNTTNQTAWMFIPPLFRWSKSGEQTEVNCPWPFIQYASGQFDKLYIWPLVGRKAVGESKNRFVLWPIYQCRESGVQGRRFRRDMLFPFFYHETLQAKPTAEVPDPAADERYFKFWPLLSYERQGQETRTRMLSLWPMRNTRGMEQNWAPLWTLYDRIRTTHQVDESLLWGLYRRRVQAEGGRTSVFPLFRVERNGSEHHSWSFLLGLLGREREGLRTTYRLLYFLKFTSGDDGSHPGSVEQEEP